MGNKHIKQLFAYEESSTEHKQSTQIADGTDRAEVDRQGRTGHRVVDDIETNKANR